MSNVVPGRWNNVSMEEPLAGGGEPPHDDGMNARIDRLDRVTEKLGDDVNEIKISIGKIETNMEHVATKTWVMAGVIAVLLAILGGGWWMIQQYLGPILQGLSKH